jgi:hypothetical protein
MTRDAAFRALGVEPGTPPDEVRRAYLRGVKTCKPEVDPEGFRRLREAYELLSQSPPAVFSPEKPPVREEDADDPEDVEDPEDEEEESWQETDPIARSLDLLAQGANREAADLVLQAMAEADARADFAHPSAWSILQIVLFLQERSAVPESREVAERLEQRLKASGDALRLLGPQLASLLIVIREMLRLPDTFPPVVRSAVARAALSGDLGSTLPELAGLVETDPTAAERAYAQLRRMPVLGPIFRPTLDPSPPPAAPPPPRQSPLNRPIPAWQGSLTFAVLLGFYLFVILTPSTPRPSASVPHDLPAEAGWAAGLRARIHSACRSTVTDTAYFFCTWAPESVQALEAGRCDEAAQKYSRAHHWNEGDPNLDPWIAEAARALYVEIMRRCPS